MDDYLKDEQVRKSIEENPYVEMDYIADDGIYLCTIGEPLRYDVRKAARLSEELGLQPGDKLPDEYWKECLF